MRHVFISAAVMANSKDQDYTEWQTTRKLIALLNMKAYCNDMVNIDPNASRKLIAGILVNATRKLIALNMKAYCNDMVNIDPNALRKLIAVILVNATRKLIALNTKAYCNDMVNIDPNVQM